MEKSKGGRRNRECGGLGARESLTEEVTLERRLEGAMREAWSRRGTHRDKGPRLEHLLCGRKDRRPGQMKTQPLLQWLRCSLLPGGHAFI